MKDKEFKIDQPGFCRRCGHKLKSNNSIKNGFGTICLKKFIKETSLSNALFDIKKGEE